MATFFIGCRVRIARGVWKGAGENLVGLERILRPDRVPGK
jgi:hypothetical protein